MSQRFPSLGPTGFALVRQVTRHTFGLVQSKLFPVYFYCLLAANLSSLVVYALYHARGTHANVQVRDMQTATRSSFSRPYPLSPTWAKWHKKRHKYSFYKNKKKRMLG